jgi:hypothetical protein
MNISSIARIAHPLDRVYSTYRNDLPSLAAYLPDISHIDVQKRTEREGGVDVLNIWHAATKIPAVARPLIPAGSLRWEDHARWDDATTRAHWKLIVPTFRNQVTCTGETRIHADGDHSRVELVGELRIDLSRMPGMNRWMGKRIAPQVESFIIQLISPNLKRVNTALERYLDEKYGRS